MSCPCCRDCSAWEPVVQILPTKSSHCQPHASQHVIAATAAQHNALFAVQPGPAHGQLHATRCSIVVTAAQHDSLLVVQALSAKPM